jgi:EAL domain-containing protein (putative c-di-GMP-specific phosphodiesterase class I)
VFSQDMNASAYERLILSNDLRAAIDNRELVLYYQPQIDLQSGRIIGAEALVRWMHPEHGLVSPAKFIPLAEETGLILPIGDWVLQEACNQAATWHGSGYPIKVSVNLSARQFRQSNFVEHVAMALAHSQLTANWLDLELTESAIIENGNQAVEMLGRLKSLGVSLSVDDFGTGYSSLSYLRQFPVDVLKIDRSFIQQIERDTKDQAVVRAIIELAHALSLSVTGEGVETEGQRSLLRMLGCNTMQGFLLSPPVPPAQFEDHLQNLNAVEPRLAA